MRLKSHISASANTYKQLPQGASTDLEEAFRDKDDAFECVTALLDDTLEQADAAVDAAKEALQQGDIGATSQVSYQTPTLNPKTYSI